MKLFTFLLLLTFVPGICQTKDPDVMIKRLKDCFSKVKDYEVEVKIKVDVDFIKVPDSHAKIYFKQPDKMHFESESFAMLPKEGMDFSPVSFLKGNFTSIYLKEDVIDGHNVSVVKVIPLSDHGDVILSTLWIDQHENIIRRVESSTKTSGTFSVDLKYEEGKRDYYLPQNMIFTFNMDKPNLPKSINGEDEPDSKKKESKTTTGKVFISYYNYKVNQGISDSMFDKKKVK